MGVGGDVKVIGVNHLPQCSAQFCTVRAALQTSKAGQMRVSPPPHRLWFPFTLLGLAVPCSPLGAPLWTFLLCHSHEVVAGPLPSCQGLRCSES